MRWMLVLIAVGCGGELPKSWALVGKPCVANADCQFADLTCGPIWKGGPGPDEYACEIPAPSTGECPASTQYWAAFLRIAPDGSYDMAYYCGIDCDCRKTDAQGYGACGWGRQCIGMCVR